MPHPPSQQGTSSSSGSKSSAAGNTPAQSAALIDVMTTYLSDLIVAQNEPQASSSVDPVTMPPNQHFPSFEFFCAEREPGITIRKYVERLVNYMRCTPECFVFALAYARRAVDLGFPLHLRSVHRLLLTACVVAAKTRDDHYYAMVYYAQVGGVTTGDLNSMELRFLLDVIDFRADVSVQEYRFICADIHQALTAAKGRSSLLLSASGSPPKVTSTASLLSDGETPGMSGACSTSSTPTGAMHSIAQPHNSRLHATGNLQLNMSKKSTHLFPTPSWILNSNLYW